MHASHGSTHICSSRHRNQSASVQSGCFSVNKLTVFVKPAEAKLHRNTLQGYKLGLDTL